MRGSIRIPLFLRFAALAVAVGAATGACGGGSDEPVVEEVRVEGFEMGFDPEEIRVPEGRVEFTFANEGTIPHTFLIEQRGFKLEAFEPGATETAVADLPEGAYFVYCDIEGHRELGMEGALYVGDVEPPDG